MIDFGHFNQTISESAKMGKADVDKWRGLSHKRGQILGWPSEQT